MTVIRIPKWKLNQFSQNCVDFFLFHYFFLAGEITPDSDIWICERKKKIFFYYYSNCTNRIYVCVCAPHKWFWLNLCGENGEISFNSVDFKWLRSVFGIAYHFKLNQWFSFQFLWWFCSSFLFIHILLFLRIKSLGNESSTSKMNSVQDKRGTKLTKSWKKTYFWCFRV